MVEFIDNKAEQSCVCKSDKMVTDILINKSQDGYIFFEIKLEKGPTPSELSGKYTNIPSAKKAVAKYLANKKETIAARRENFNKAREERKKENGSKNSSKGSKHIHQGLDN